MNIIDVLAILPYYVELWMAVEKGTNEADVHSSEPADNFLSVNLTNTILAVDTGETEEDNLKECVHVGDGVSFEDRGRKPERVYW